MPTTNTHGPPAVGAYSPDGSVSARLAMGEGLTLDYHPAGLDHSDAGLERQLQHVLEVLLANATAAMRPPALLGDDVDSRIAAARGERASELLEDFDATEGSPDGAIRIRLRGDGSVAVDVAYGAVGELGGDRVVGEAAQIVRRLFAAQAAKFDEVHDEVVNRLLRSELEERVNGRDRH